MELASDTITEGNSSNLMEVTEPIEESSAVTTAFPAKRKADSDPADVIQQSGDEIEESGDGIEESGDKIEESGDGIEESGDEIEESSDEMKESGDEIEEIDYDTKQRRYVEEVNAYFRSKWINPEWDVDSFDGLEFDVSEEERLCICDDDDLDVEQWLRFRRQHIENKGFYVDPELWPMYKYSDYRVISDLERSAGKGLTYRTFFSQMACLCLERFNKDQKEKNEGFIDVEFVEVVGGVIRPCSRPKAFITFKAKEKPDGPLVEYQAKIWSKPGVIGHYPILCRPAPPRKV